MLKSSIKILLVSIAGLAALFSFLNFILLKKEIQIDNSDGAKQEARPPAGGLNQGLPLLSPPPATAKQAKKTKTAAKETSAFNVGNRTPPTNPPASGRINILLLGMSGPGYEAPDLTDTILVLSVDPSAGSATMISLPRDLYVEVPEIEDGRNYYAGYFTKINALYQLNKNTRLPAPDGRRPDGGQGESEELAEGMIKQKIGQMTGLEIDNYVLMDLEGLKEIIDQIGGLNVFVEKDVFDPRFPAKNFATETFELKNGWRWLDGQTALRYIRTRHDIEGDFGRIKRQQAVLEALRKKILGMSPLWDLPKIIEIVRTLRRDFKTDLDVLDIKRLWDISRKIDSSSKIKHIVIDANQENGLLEESTAMLGGKTGFILIPKAGVENYEEINEFIAQNL